MQNKIANILRIIGFVTMGLGLILGIALGRVDVGIYDYEQNWSITLTWWATGFISGMLFVGFAEIIELLHKINLKLGKSDDENVINENGKKEVYSRKEASALYESAISKQGEK